MGVGGHLDSCPGEPQPEIGFVLAGEKKRGTFFPLSLVIESGLRIPVKMLPILMLRREAGGASFSQCIVTGDRSRVCLTMGRHL